MFRNLMRFVLNRSGTSAVEYALICGIISLVLIGIYTTLGPRIEATFALVSDGLPQP